MQGLGWILANLVFFAPRRNVTLTLEPIERSQLPGLDRQVLNPWLERWYNEGDGAETPTFVPIHFLFGPRTREFPTYESTEEIDLGLVRGNADSGRRDAGRPAEADVRSRMS
ncbi:MAG: hypothetical protein U0736_18400 [Gemmataceae bacterium]